MKKCYVEKSEVWDDGTEEMSLLEMNEKASQAGKNYFLYGSVLFMTRHPFDTYPFDPKRNSTGFFKKDLLNK